MTQTLEFHILPIDQIRIGSTNPRGAFDEAAWNLADLMRSIEANGLQQPITVTRTAEPGVYDLVAGERRLRAMRALRKPEILALVAQPLDPQNVRVLQLVENLQRENIHPIEEARAMRQLLDEGLSPADIAAQLGTAQGFVRRRLRLLAIDPKVAKRIQQDFPNWNIRHWEALASVDPEAQEQVLKSVGNWSLQSWSPDQLAKHLDKEFLRTLKKTPWKLDDATLDPKAGACSECPSRSVVEIGLFEDKASSNGPGRCLNALCYARKLELHLAARAGQLRNEHKNLLLITGKGESYRGPLTPVIQHYDVKEVKKGSRNSVPALIVSGPEAGRVTYVEKPKPEKTFAQPGGKRIAAGAVTGEAPVKEEPTTEERLKRLEDRRRAHVVQIAQEQVRDRSWPQPTETTLLTMAAAFGTSGGWRMRDPHRDPESWTAVAQLTVDPQNSKLRAKANKDLWDRLAPVFADRLNYSTVEDAQGAYRDVQALALVTPGGEALLAQLTRNAEAAVPMPKVLAIALGPKVDTAETPRETAAA